jgi:hypothetical protein
VLGVRVARGLDWKCGVQDFRKKCPCPSRKPGDKGARRATSLLSGVLRGQRENSEGKLLGYTKEARGEVCICTTMQTPLLLIKAPHFSQGWWSGSSGCVLVLQDSGPEFKPQ